MVSIIHQPDCFMCVLCLKDSPRSGASGLTSVGPKPKRKGEVRIARRKGLKTARQEEKAREDVTGERRKKQKGKERKGGGEES